MTNQSRFPFQQLSVSLLKECIEKGLLLSPILSLVLSCNGRNPFRLRKRRRGRMAGHSDCPVPLSVPVFPFCLNVRDIIGCSFAPGLLTDGSSGHIAPVPSMPGTDVLRSSHIILLRAGCQKEWKHTGGLGLGGEKRSRWDVFTAWSGRLTTATEAPPTRNTAIRYRSPVPPPASTAEQCRPSQALSQGSQWPRSCTMGAGVTEDPEDLGTSLLLVAEGRKSPWSMERRRVEALGPACLSIWKGQCQ